MVESAPRYDPKIYDLIRALDDREQPIAETCRRIGAAASELRLPRPSYVHLRRLVHLERDHQDAIREVIDDVVYRAVAGLRINAYEVADQVGRIRRERDARS